MKGGNLRALRVGTGSEFRLFQDGQDIGRVDDSAVTFLGFVSHDDAALAALAASRALGQRRGNQAPSLGVSEGAVKLLPPAPEDDAATGWGFQIALLPNERAEVFALARARVIWRALQGTGVPRRMLQFADGPVPA